MVIRLPDIRVPSGCKMPATVAFKSGQDSCHRPVKLIVTKHAIEERLLPTLEQQLASVIPPGPDWQVAVDPDDPDQQTLLFHYPGVLQPKEASLSPYVRPVVRVELGARSDTEPLEHCEIEPTGCYETLGHRSNEDARKARGSAPYT